MGASSSSSSGSGRRRRRLTPQEKYQVFLDVVAGQGSQREVADKWRVDRSSVVHIVKVARQGALDALAASRPGRPGKTAVEVALEDALADNTRLREAIAEQAIELHLVRAKDGWG